MRDDILNQKEKIEEWITLNKSKAFMCKEFKCKPETLESYLIKLGIDYKGNQGSRGSSSPFRKTALEYLASEKYVKTHMLRLKLLEDGIKEHKCEICCFTTWNGEKIPLELHHIDGDRFNNELNNLQILCPNCHSQTENNSGKKNKKK